MRFLRRLTLTHITALTLIFTLLTIFQNCTGVGFSTPDGSSSSNAGQGTGTGGNANGTIGQNGGGGTSGTIGQPGTAGSVTCTGAACANGGSNPCSTVLNTTTTPVKVLFVVDTSGSNEGICGTPCAATDHAKAMRAGAIQQFFNDYSSKANFYWGFIYFQQNFAQALINGGNASDPVFSSNPAVMQAAITNFLGITDQGQTPYPSALSMAQQAISMDSSAPLNSKYIVVFLSDGMPYPDPGDSVIDPEVQSVVNVRPSESSFNTIFYGYQSDVQAASRLQSYATLGGGLFLNVWSNPTGNSFQIVNTISVPGSTCNH